MKTIIEYFLQDNETALNFEMIELRFLVVSESRGEEWSGLTTLNSYIQKKNVKKRSFLLEIFWDPSFKYINTDF